MSARRGCGSCIVAWVALIAACDGSVGAGAGSDRAAVGGQPTAAPAPGMVCTTEREYFAREVWGRVLGKVCVQCHAPGGVASEQNAQLQLLPATYPGFLDANFENVSQVAKFSFEGEPVLLQKPLGKLSHGGGAPLREDSEEYRILQKFLAGSGAQESCVASNPLRDGAGVSMLDAQATFRKASLQLAGRLPTEPESERLVREGEAALGPLLETLMGENAFIERIVELYNDRLLTDFYLRFVGAAVNLLSDQDYPGAGNVYGMLDDDTKRRANLGVAREPLWIIAHVVRNDLPFSEILTADYTIVNAGSAGVYGVAAPLADPTDDKSWQAVQVTAQREKGPVAIPHAGLLTTPAFLNRFPTSGTNRNRHRARKVYDFFLATDILKAGDRPIDPLASTRFNNPTRDDAQCSGCHRQIDPIAGGFMKWNEGDQERYDPDKDWYPDMVAPGFAQEVMEKDEYGHALQWLAQRVVADPRFVLSTIHTVYRGLTGQKPLAYPADSEGAAGDAQLTAWLGQDATFRVIGTRFVDDGMRFKTLVRELVLSPEFRAVNAAVDTADVELPRLAAMGTGQLSTPERLAAKIEAVTGVPWARDSKAEHYLLQEFEILYGGIDSDAVVDRLTQPNGIMASVAARMANEVSCRVTAWDFTRPRGDRRLFADVEPSDVPESALGGATPAVDSVERIRRAIRHLHERVLGETLAAADPELERTYGLFLETWREGVAASTAAMEAMDDAAKKRATDLPSPCRARVDLATGTELPEQERIESDPNHTIHAWMAVMTYLLSDYQFLYER